MNVELPDGTVVEDIPDGMSKRDLATKLKSNGMAVPDEWLAGQEVGVGAAAKRGVLRGAGHAVRGMGILGAGVVARVAEMMGNTEVGDKLFAAADDFAKWGDEAAKPQAGEVMTEKAKAAQALGGAAPMLASMAVMGPVAGAVMGGGGSGADTYATNLEQGVDNKTALKQAGIAAAANTIGAALPAAVPGALAVRLATGAAANVAAGQAQRVASNEVYGDQYPEMKQEFSPGEAAADAIMGGVAGKMHDPLKGGKPSKKQAAKAADAKAAEWPADKMQATGDDEFRAPNGATVTKEAWEASSPKIREGWMKPKPVEEKAPTAETKELTLEEANKLQRPEDLVDTSAEDKLLAEHPAGEIAKVAAEVREKKLKDAVAAADQAKNREIAADMRRVAGTTDSPELKAALLKKADQRDPPAKIPAGATVEGQPAIKSDAPTKPLPVGKAAEVALDDAVPAAEVPKAGEIPAGEVVPEGGTRLTRDEADALEAEGKPIPVGEATPIGRPAESTASTSLKGLEVTEHETLPVGEVREGQPDIPVPKEKIPAGEAIEGDVIPVGEAIEVPTKIPAGEATEVTRSGATPVERVDLVPAGETKDLYVDPKRDVSLDAGFPKIDETFMAEQARAPVRGAEARAAVNAPEADRGRRQVRAALEEGAASGKLDKDGVALATWALDKNPNLAAGLRLEASETPPIKGAKGSYESAKRVVQLFKGSDNAQTAAHEIFHHTERMMPQKVQEGIRREWRRAIQAEAKGASPAMRAALNDIPRAMKGDADARTRLFQAFREGTLDAKKHYHLFDPSEFWAVNAARILADRHGGRGSWTAEAKQWVREMVEHMKSTIGLRSDAPVLKALNEILDAGKTTGADRSPTIIKKAAGAADDLAFALGNSPPKKGLPDETRTDVVERKLFDRFNRVAKLQDVLPPKRESADIYGADNRYHGRLQARGDKLEKEAIRPLGKLLEKAKKVGVSVRDADDYLMALHAPERNAVIAQRNPKMQDGGSGLTNKQAQDIIDSFTPEQRQHLDAVAKVVHDLNRQKLDGMVEDGLVTPQQRDALNAQFKNYVPLKTLDGEETFLGTGQGYAMRANDIASALGRQSKASSPIAASVMDASRAMVRGEKARVDRAIWEYADKDAHEFIRPYDPDHPPAEVMDRKLGADGKVKDIVSSKKVQDLTIPLVVNGKDVRVFVPDQLLRDQLMKVATTADPGPVLSAIGKGTSTIGRLLTEFNPTFTIPNAVKDAITVAVRAGAHPGVSTAKVMANIPKAWKTIIEHKAGAKTKGAAEYEEFLKHGGKTGAYGIQSSADTMSKLEKLGAELGYDEHKAGYARKLGRFLAHVPRAISGANEVLEYASRFAMYKEVRAAGGSPAKAASAAKEVTVNFNRSGEWGRTLNSVLVFANAALQGLRNTGVYMKSPHVRKGVMGIVALGAASQYWNETVGGENEETAEPNINSQNDAVADKNLVMLKPGSREGFKIPLPPEYAAFFALGRRLYRAASQQQYGREAAGIAGAVLDTTLPVRLPEADSSALSVGRAMVPTLAAPVSEVWLNQSYFGTPIVPAQRGRTAVPYFTQSRVNTSELAKSVSEIANSVTGGDNVKPGYSQKVLGPLVSPEGLEHLVKGYTGGVGQIAMQAGNIKKSMDEGKPLDVNKVPVASRFVFQEPQSYTSRRYKELSEDYEQAKGYRKLNESAKISPRVQATLEQYEVAEKELTALFKELREAGAAGTDREPIQQRIKAAQSRVIRAYNQTK